MNEEEYQYIQQLQQQNNELKAVQTQGSLSSATSSMWGGQQNQNLIEWQLELNEIIEKIDHLLRGDVLKYDEKNNLIWTPPEDKGHQVFNEYGVQEILRVLSMYLNRNTILSNYDEDTINWKVYDFGTEIADFVLLSHRKMGMDNNDKLKHYPMIMKELTDTVHSAFLRALAGGERESLRTARTVTQNDQINPMPDYSKVMPKKKSLFNPLTWGK